ncbi:amidohydrolase family protein [Paracoccus sediminicola]|uniref:amidohydrolase family protein n=1 Tax=Paracoccus sediminicola TaxID=3017783 RepID=UPI0022F04D4D|nr:amidohydrolase [Paracoccus sediminicola]WBU56133.1 amidohydrolase [Paracoccus sediminicola]
MTGILDTHLHTVDRSRIRYPWIDGAGALDRDWSHAEYATEAAGLGIVGALHMEVDAAQEMIAAETEMIAGLPPRDDVPILGIIGACRPEHDGFAAEIERAQTRKSVVGFRRVLHVVPDALSESETFRANIRRLGPAGLPFDLCVQARQLPLAIALVDAAPDTQFVLDHCGVPDIAGGAFEGWASDMAELAQRPNVAAKISGLPAYASAGWTADDLRRWTDHVVSHFGFDRLVWGSDWFVCTLGGGLTKWVEASRALFGDGSDTEKAALFAGNARRIWRLTDG